MEIIERNVERVREAKEEDSPMGNALRSYAGDLYDGTFEKGDQIIQGAKEHLSGGVEELDRGFEPMGNFDLGEPGRFNPVLTSIAGIYGGLCTVGYASAYGNFPEDLKIAALSVPLSVAGGALVDYVEGNFD